MILGFLRLAVIGFLVLSVVYVAVAIYSRSVRRETLEKRYDSGDISLGDAEAGRDAYIAEGMRAYERGLRRRLLWLVYIIPTVVFTAVFWTLNYA